MEALQYLATLTAGYPPEADLRLELRCLPPRGERTENRPPRYWYPLNETGIDAAARSVGLWAASWDVYAGVLPRVGRKGGQSDVRWAGWLYVDVDGGDRGPDGAEALLTRTTGLPRATMLVVSGGGVHAYWRLAAPVRIDEAEDRQRFRLLLHRLAQRVGGVSPGPHADPSASEPARILRVPGTLNHKQPDNPRPVRILTCDDGAKPMGAEDWDTILPTIPATRPRPVNLPAGLVTPGLQRWAEAGYPQGNRHKDLVAAAAWLVRDCQLPAAVAEELLLIKAARSPGLRQITPDEVRRMVRWA